MTVKFILSRIIYDSFAYLVVMFLKNVTLGIHVNFVRLDILVYFM